jgi:selenocysteine lyase/cysteine desulfurase
MGATFDASGLYRFNAIQQKLAAEALTTACISAHVQRLQQELLKQLHDTVFACAELLNPISDAPHARFLAFRSPDAQRWCDDLSRRNCVVDVRGEVLRIGLGLYHHDADIDRFAELARGLS